MFDYFLFVQASLEMTSSAFSPLLRGEDVISSLANIIF